ncbi:SDR family NAD(P)-dependent oxidoreductase [Geodermatophilus sabuli]|uniref:NAD(P)-dependent dehydrogenase, short-chain alcohol dehydrogenase family n=1 Tax=Geodermatophilus sabuli TaxID=1564158 RepID=A0A285E6I7_9ACTN|nr:SDR family NAD(P)-dependent oxidoreductase [Geodermatophilus sabuli]MBB3082495.1 NAD(P)-dependent dehydrogenase (short-subunit alcohol dehydrogenase family) [Geodermatophilus sabuli]SNX94635.1 NAD(P)-dependent dehydrogenase, short-chain alcohol dehydrogenase family [Geodermatophilus sabuli]
MAGESVLDFEGRVAIVTGAGQGMGREHAVMLASRGARVVVNDINEGRAKETVEAVTGAGGTAVVDSHDIVTASAELVQTAIDAFGRLDIVVNNAGINAYGRFWEMDADLWWRVFNTSFQGLVQVARHAMPHLIESGTGRMINVSSNALMGLPNDTSYAAAKAAIWGLGNSLAGEGREVGVQVSTILPVAWTPMLEDAFADPVIQQVLRENFPASAVSAFVTWLAHQDTTVHGQAFEIGGVAAARTVFSVLPRVQVAEATPEEWAANASTLMQDGELTPLPAASDSFRAQVVNLAPEMDAYLPADAANVSGN